MTDRDNSPHPYVWGAAAPALGGWQRDEAESPTNTTHREKRSFVTVANPTEYQQQYYAEPSRQWHSAAPWFDIPHVSPRYTGRANTRQTGSKRIRAIWESIACYPALWKFRAVPPIAGMVRDIRLDRKAWGILLGLALVIGIWASPFKITDSSKIVWSNAPYATGNAQVANAQAPNKVSSGVSAPAGNHSVVGAPSVNPQKIADVLRSYNSPAVGAAQAMYDLGLKYGIDPAFALAFFINESNAGTRGVAVTSLSIGNIRWTQGCGFANVQGYRGYANWEAGIEDWYKLIKNLYVGSWGLQTTEAIIPRYAPSADRNNPPAYIAHVNTLVDGWRSGK